MPVIALQEQTFTDPLIPQMYGDVIAPATGVAGDAVSPSYYGDVVKTEEGVANTVNGGKAAFGGFDVDAESVRDHADTFGMASTVSAADDVRFWAGASFANRNTAPFRVTESGAIVGTSGAIGGFDIGTDYIRDAGNSFGLASTVTGGDDVRFWAGAAYASRSTAPFRVTESGVMSLGQSGSSPYMVLDGPNNRIGTSDFSAGLIGWRITGAGDAEFANAEIRGAIHSSVFSYGEKHATAGTSVLAKSAGKLRSDVTSATSPTTFNVDIEDPDTGHVQLFEASDVLTVKDGSGNENWWTISSVSDQTTFYRYVCTKSSGSNATFRKGAAIIDYGQSGDGIILMTVDEANSPRASVYTHAGSPWSTLTERLRWGNLNGFLSYVADIYGFAVGDATSFVTADPTNGVRASGRITSQDSMTTGHLIPAGSAVAVESDGLIYRTRPTAFSTANTRQTFSVDGGTSIAARSKMIELSSTVKLYWLVDSSEANAVDIVGVLCSPTSSTVTLSATEFTSGDMDICKLTSTLAFLAYERAGSIHMRTLSVDASAVPTANAEVTIAVGTEPWVVRVSDTEAIVFYTDTNSDAIALQVTIAGTVPTAGTSNTVATHAADVYTTMAVERFTTSTDTYIFYYRDTTNSIAYVKAATYSGGTLTFGSAVDINESGVFPTKGVFGQVDSTTMAMFHERSSFIRGRVITVSGTTLTVNAGSNVVALGAASYPITCGALGTYLFVLGYRRTAAIAELKLVEVDGTSITAVGTVGDVSQALGESFAPAAVYLSPSRIVVARDDENNLEGCVQTIDMTTNYSSRLGVAPSQIAKSAAGTIVFNGYVSGLSGLTAATEYFADMDGQLTTAALGGSSQLLTATAATTGIVQRS